MVVAGGAMCTEDPGALRPPHGGLAPLQCGSLPLWPQPVGRGMLTALEEEFFALRRNRHGGPDEMSDDTIHDVFESGLKPLWMRARTGDDAAYRAALERIAARLRNYFARRLQHLPDDVEDLVQETLLALHLQRGTYDPALPVSAWVHSIARHKLIDLWRRRGRREALHEPLDDLDDSMMPVTEDSFPAQRDLAVLINTLPKAQQQAIVLTRIEGLSMAEASARTGVSVAALKVQVHRGLKRLAELVKDKS